MSTGKYSIIANRCSFLRSLRRGYRQLGYLRFSTPRDRKWERENDRAKMVSVLSYVPSTLHSRCKYLFIINCKYTLCNILKPTVMPMLYCTKANDVLTKYSVVTLRTQLCEKLVNLPNLQISPVNEFALEYLSSRYKHRAKTSALASGRKVCAYFSVNQIPRHFREYYPNLLKNHVPNGFNWCEVSLELSSKWDFFFTS